MSESKPFFPETDGFVPLLKKVEAIVERDVALAEAARPGVLAESRSLPRDALTAAWQRAPGEVATGRVVDARA